MHRLTGWIVAGCAVAAPVTAFAQSAVTVARGESVTITLSEGEATVLARAPITVSPFEKAIGAEFARGDHANATGANAEPMRDDGTRPNAPVPAADRIRIRFMRIDGDGSSLLVIENGYDRGMVYHATIRTAGRSAPTDVCLVMPGKSGTEHWPYAIESIELSAMSLEPWTPDDGIKCA